MKGNAILIGMMGSGKTTVGRLVAERTGMEFIDLDQMIVDRAGKSIAMLFEQEGESTFRQLETEALRETLAATHAVVATGGGIIMRPENRQLLRQLGTVFWLDAPANVLLDRIGDDETRPMLRGGAALKRLDQLGRERREHYAESSDFHLDTSELTPDEIVERITQQLDVQRETGQVEDVFSTIIAIDGPVGSGKSAVARLLARRLHYTHVDTGAMYRCVTLEATRRGVPLTDAAGLTSVAHSIDIRFDDSEEDEKTPLDVHPGMTGSREEAFPGRRVLLNGEDVTDSIRSPEISRSTSPVADVPTVRAEMVRLQREMALRGHSVLEGRDISTVVVPEAHWKFYLVASLEERVMRRYRQYVDAGNAVDINQLRVDVATRDERDRTRSQGALKLASDATIFDTTAFPLDEVIETMAVMIEAEAEPPATGRK